MNKTNVIIKAAVKEIIEGRKPIDEVFKQLSRLARKVAYV